MKHAIILLKTRTINFHLSESFGCALILEQDETACTVVSSQSIPISKRHGNRHDSLVEASNSANVLLENYEVPKDAIQRLAWDDRTRQYRTF